MKDTTGVVIGKKEVIKGHFKLQFRLSLPFQNIIPGQFVMVKIPSCEVFLRRPFSIYDYQTGLLSILFRVVGKGTQLLSDIEEGDAISILGPLGKGFSVNPDRKPIIVGGGIGIAGIHLLTKTIGEKASVYFGCTSITETPLVSDISHLKPFIATLDGSSGFKGNVVDMLKAGLEARKSKDVQIYACGPEGMLRSIKEELRDDGIPCQVLIEERMACGMGLCFGCVKKTYDEREPFKRVCKEGPVFDLWQIYL